MVTAHGLFHNAKEQRDFSPPEPGCDSPENQQQQRKDRRKRRGGRGGREGRRMEGGADKVRQGRGMRWLQGFHEAVTQDMEKISIPTQLSPQLLS